MTATTAILTIGSPVGEPAIVNPVLCELNRQLQCSPFAAIKKLHCEFHEGVALLRGRVPTFYTRQVALTLVLRVAGVEQVDDRIVVDGPDARQR